ncbi:hypothetical protein DL764_006938 [Monosporascus ibericus]|uniref:Peptidase S8/S53 domain-containing protein n=1 Tax=Monosporascus ibericus TaxID=155417 RepID=A0A4Q4T3F9_9PEZI|nr:hypothetical protein DL764_006938 [Monosporascus ibericus]
MAGFSKQAALLLSAIVPALAAPTTPQHGSAVPGKYIVKVKPELTEVDFEGQVQWVADVHKRSISRRDTAGLQKTFSFGGFKAYTGEFDDGTVALIKANESVLIVEPDLVVNPLDEFVTQENAEFNLALLSSLGGFGSRDAVNPYVYDESAGTGQFAYVIDTGIYVEHEDFGGRAFQGYNARPEIPWRDDFGHGTHCAGTVGSNTYGVAKNITLFDVKVLDQNGAGSISNMLDGYTWVVNNATAEGRIGRSLVSMSLGWPRSDIINDAVQAAYEAGLLTVVSAGNDFGDPYNKSPASAPQAVTVGSTDYQRSRAYYSNAGSLIDIWAAGSDVRSLATTQGGTTVKSGTSMSTPAVAGLVAYLRALHGGLEDPAAAVAKLKEVALRDVVSDVRGSPNLFAHNGAAAVA